MFIYRYGYVYFFYVVDPVFQYLLNGLQNKDLALMSAYALSKFSNRCCHMMSKMFPILLEVQFFLLKTFFFNICSVILFLADSM